MRTFDSVFEAVADLRRRVRALEARLARTSGPATVTALDTGTFDNSDALTAYPYGVSIMAVVTSGAGWPEQFGLVETLRMADDYNRQTFTSMNTSPPNFLVRRWVISTEAWTAWSTL